MRVCSISFAIGGAPLSVTFGMKGDGLFYFWIEHSDMHGPLGYGVTAFSESDAFQIVEGLGYQVYAADKIRQITTVDEIPHHHVREHMGPIVVRGLWYPFTSVGGGT